MSDSVFNVLIIGAGAIGALCDTPQSDCVLTHAHAFTIHPGFNLLGFVDTDPERSQHAAKLWGCAAFPSIEEAFVKERVDVACITVPDELHYRLLKEIAQYPLQAVFAEKPLTQTVCEAEEIAEIYSDRSVPVCVNYRRRFVPEFESLRQKIRGEALGEFLTGTGYYGKGFLHNGSHLIHLLTYLIGAVTGHRVVATERDFYLADPSISVHLSFEGNRPFFLQHFNCNYFTIFEVDLLFEKGRVRITDTGLKIEYQTTVEHTMFKGYTFLAKTEEVETTLGRSLYFSADNIYNHLTKQEQLKCSVYDALETMRVCDKIRAV